MKYLELYTDSVFSVGIRSVFLGIYHTDTEGKLGRYISIQKRGGSNRPKYRKSNKSDTGKIPIPKKLPVPLRYTTLEIHIFYGKTITYLIDCT
jgi:hypothetical protein